MTETLRAARAPRDQGRRPGAAGGVARLRAPARQAGGSGRILRRGAVEGEGPGRGRRPCGRLRPRSRRGAARGPGRDRRWARHAARARLDAGRPLGRGLLHRRPGGRGRVRRLRGGGPRSRGDRQRGRPAASLRREVRRHRQPLAAGRGHLDGGRRPGLRPDRARPDRGDAAPGLRPLGRGGPRLARRRHGALPRLRGAPCLLGALHRPGFRGAGPRPLRHGSRGIARRDGSRPEGRGGDPGRGRPRRRGASDPQGAAGAPQRRRDPLRRPRRPGDPRLCPPRGAHHAGGQDRPRPVLPPGRHQRADGPARPLGQAGGAAEIRRPAGLRPGRRGDRGLPGRRHPGHRGPRGLCRAGCSGGARRVPDPSGRRAPAPVRHRPRPPRGAAGRPELGRSPIRASPR